MKRIVLSLITVVLGTVLTVACGESKEEASKVTKSPKVASTDTKVDNTVADISKEVDNTVADISKEVDNTVADISKEVDNTVADISKDVDEKLSDLGEKTDELKETLTEKFNEGKEKVAPGSTDPNTPPNCAEDIKNGEWVHYKMSGMEMKQKVTEVTEEFYSIQNETIMNGKTLSTNSQKVPRKAPEVAAVAKATMTPKYSRENVTVKGKEINCWLIEMEANGKTSRTWMSNDVPVGGLIKSEYDGKVVMELVDFGWD